MSRNGTATATAFRDFSDDLSTDLSQALAILEEEQVSFSVDHSEDDYHATLEQLLTGVRWLIPADGASIYLRRGGTLKLTVVQNETLSRHLGDNELRRRLQGLQLNVNSSSIAGYVALTGHLVNVPDVESISPDSHYKFCPAIDRKTYLYCSVLTAPIVNEAGVILGVVQLINALDEEAQPAPFEPDAEAIVRQFAAQVARVISRRAVSARLHRLS
jgi:GAF domain-containing protein